MSNIILSSSSFPESVAVIGGGRWARVILGELCKLTASDTNISIHTQHNTLNVKKWLREKKLEKRVKLCSKWPTFNTSPSVMIVANAARDHYCSVEYALLSGVPVLVEKPVSKSANKVKSLIKLAQNSTRTLAAAQVFLFANYIHRFCNRVSHLGKPEGLEFHWVDPKNEERFGENKHYDRGVPVFVDWIPHILPIIKLFFPKGKVDLTDLKVRKGGAKLTLGLMADGRRCLVKLERNGQKRKRYLSLDIGQEKVELDFSEEPGTVTWRGEQVSADPTWNFTKKPLSAMLTAFLQASTTGIFDERLNIESALQSYVLIDSVRDKYYHQLFPWVEKKITGNQSENDEVDYSLTELVSVMEPIYNQELKSRILALKSMVLEYGLEVSLKKLGLFDALLCLD
ncbi:Gfo/Idh/MocA family oxidoreductase [Spartinivicinus poritis]|uniref:Gfo/Idh/MocA family oxidoreductase n=1 Tax=Spartinivicinus poritis TaxID=2994640 RepID=A0ABT5UAW6_9GAMM|nr:Gfo/Idh/MocA family oxidoreductase [Spartinivicinus sp. A2-2]MDE1462269.1 Gfo/Idh/MocA family oxidoreductase [Spartinivicinus sp. A2-2]